MYPVIDGHIDVLYALKKQNRAFSSRSDGNGHCDLPRMKEGNYKAALFAIYPAKTEDDIQDGLDGWFNLVNMPENKLFHIKSVNDFTKAKEIGKIGAVLHFEGSGGIDPNFKILDDAYNRGLRTMGITHANVNKFGTGFLFSENQIGSGLTPKGMELVQKMQSMGITVDVSHLNDKSFWDVLKITQKPIIASHSNCRSLCGILRNLSDEQIRAIHDVGGTIGINFGIFMLTRDKNINASNMKLDLIKKHIDYIINLADINTVAIGSDFDGVGVPNCIKDASYIQKLFNYLSENNLTKNDIEKISHKNLLRIFKDTWKN
ncbi:MAG: dipeptidase [Promethearchaeota archaeon]